MEQELKKKKKVKKVIGGGDVFYTVIGTAADDFVHQGIPWKAKKTVEVGRYGASELMRNKNLQKKLRIMVAINSLQSFKILLVGQWTNYQQK